MLKVYEYENSCGDKGIIIAEKKKKQKRFTMQNILTGKLSLLSLGNMTVMKSKELIYLKSEI